MVEKKTTKKSAGVTKLKSLLPKKNNNYIILLPDELDEGVHWLFWVLILLIVVFVISIITIKFTDLPNTISLLF
ncbi:TPA: hypothetical protein DCR79_01805 [Patescibacteria group bacterium]|nr:MAG: hypothetical protein UV88_C0013G0002 [Parcubacteria group bacterium GW2011_GWA1_43_21]HAR55001.1 hypothetical protein [Patescibacteria group bacterium]HCR42067.1 hypothetical protein [Patescibacteria group bacterium]